MKLSVKSDYAARAVLGLAKYYQTGESRRVEDLAAEQGVPAKYLVQILIELKSRNLVRSVRGKDGGYLLSRAPAEITMGEVIRTVEGAIFDSPALYDRHCPEVLHQVWLELQGGLEKAAESINFQQLLDRATGGPKMYYI